MVSPESPDLSTEARLVAVADGFTALLEDRPYRTAMSPTSALRILEAMAADKLLDGDIIATLVRHLLIKVKGSLRGHVCSWLIRVSRNR
jgi:HD-GYP domain-containing protein (c-di-GMP phosphodiesterase class II)